MNIPEGVKFIINALSERGHEAFIVGGCVRDIILGNTPKDWDITTSATPYEVKDIFGKVIETGIQHGTVTVLINGEAYEVTTYRIDGAYVDFRRPSNVLFTKNLEEDLMRRDFTMNAIAYRPETGFVDPYKGIDDIKQKIIRAVGDPDRRFNEDALRMLRAIRFSCRLGFGIEEKTLRSIEENARLIENISVERIRDEVIKAFSSEYIENIFYFEENRLIKYALPQSGDYFYKKLRPVSADLKRLSKIKESSLSQLFTLLFQYMAEEDFCGNLTYLKLDNKTFKEATILRKHLFTPLPQNRYEVKKLINSIGYPCLLKLMELKKIKGEDIFYTESTSKEIIDNKEPVSLKDLKINGNDMQKLLNIKGKAVGALLLMLLDDVMKSPELNEKDILISLGEKYKNSMEL